MYMICLMGFLFLPGCKWSSSSTMQPSGIAHKETRAIGTFDKLSIADVGTVLFTQGNNHEFIIEADKAIMPYIVSRVEQEKLHVSIQNLTHFSSPVPITYYITAPDLKEIELQGAAGFQTLRLQTNSLSIDLMGASEVSGVFMLHDLKVHAQGASKVILEGQADNQHIMLEGASIYDARACSSSKVTIDAQGAAQVIVQVRDILHAIVSGTASLSYIGEPRLTIKQSGMAIINNVMS